MPHIALLSLQSPTTLEPRHIEQFKVGLVENGLVEGRNITVDYFWGEGSTERLLQLATELAQRNLDVIVTSGPQPLRALLATRTKTPIVFAILSDPIGDGFIQSLARPGGNITGLSMSGTDLESRAPLEVLKNAVPTIDKVMILHDPSMGSTALSEVKTGARFLARATGARSDDTAAALPMRAMNSDAAWLPPRAGDHAKYVELYHISGTEPGGVRHSKLGRR